MTATAHSSLEGGPRLWTREETRPSAGRHHVAHIIHAAIVPRKRLLSCRPGWPNPGLIPGLILVVAVETVAGERIDELSLLVGEVREQGIGEQVRGVGQLVGTAGLADVVHQRAVNRIQDPVDD